MSDDPIDHMHHRAASALRLADSILDSEASEPLRQMAAEIEADILKLEAERAALPRNEMRPQQK